VINNHSPEKSIVIFGAGKIGRSFIGQLFSRSGYKIIFIDVDQRIINELNRRQKYTVVIKSTNDELLEIVNVSGIYANDKESVIKAIADCSLMATCVGKNALPKILPILAKAIENRIKVHPEFPLDIILAENIRDACNLVKGGISELLSEGFPVNAYIGFIETSIGKMVPIMPLEIENSDALLVYAESYNTLIIDKIGFKNPIPQVIGLAPVDNIKAWVDRKAFIHNLGHVAAAYFGFFKYPERKYLFEVLENHEVHLFTREAMEQSAKALIAEYPDVFTEDDLHEHIQDLVNRFRNNALGDTIFRIGSDLKRKLSGGDRIIGAIKLAQKHNCPYNRLIEVLIYGLLFRAKDESGQLFEGDIDFAHDLELDIDNLLTSVCGFNKKTDIDDVLKIRYQYKFLLESNKQIKEK
jgi:mannitol-1-phosphate 5-dehydrogenase